MKRILAILLALVMLIGLLPTAALAAEEAANDNLLRIWYDEPATDWQTQALAIGNGYMGGMVFGGVGKDKIHINEKTVWAGGPTAYSDRYNYGATNPIATEEDLAAIKANLEAIRQKLDDKSEFVFGFDEETYVPSGTNTRGEAMDWLNKLMGDLYGYSAPVDYANIYLDFSKAGHTNSNVTNYVRDLDMRTGLATVSYDYDGVHYTREYLNSYPDNVLAIRITADQAAKLSFDTSLTLASSYGFTNRVNTAEGSTITLRADLSDNGLKTMAKLQVLNEGGELLANSNGSISVTNADAVTIIMACGTDYAMTYPKFRGEDPTEAVTARVAAAAEKGYEAVKEAHVADHSELFSRLELGFNEEIPQIPTDELLAKYRNMVDGDGSNAPTEAEQRALEIICYQFGRYLTIAGSREGGLPTNLQGVWGEGSFAWGGDYHFNINVQMNYWPTMASNLGECLLPFNTYLEALREGGRVGAAAAFGIKSEPSEENGWLVGCFSTPYMFASMGQKNNAAGWNPIGSAWALLNAYEYYLYTGDVEYLRDNIYPSMKEVANFWNEALWWSETQQRYVSAPSYSPENGPIVNGASYDQQFIWQHFENTIQAAEILGMDEDLIATWRDKQSQLDPVLVGESGQVKEWFEETTFGKAQAGDLEEINIPLWRASLGASVSGKEPPHRHISQLMALYPCTMISKDNAEFMDAAIVTLEERGLDASGWSKGHKLNLWARTGNGEKSFELVKSAVGGGNSGFLNNLFSSHGGGANYKDYPIFQIDGNYGYTAGVNEMLLQSQLGYTQFLPALPEAWNTGFINGIVARGNFEIDMKWTDGQANEFKITSNIGGTFTGEYENLAGYTVLDAEGNAVPTTKLSKDKIAFETTAGETYTINFDNADEMEVQKGVASALIASMTDEALAPAKAALEAALANAADASALAAANETASTAISFMGEISAAQAVHDEKAAAGSDVAQVLAAIDNLQAEINKAKELLANTASTKADFDAQAKVMTKAADDITGIEKNFVTFLNKIAAAEEFAADHSDMNPDWTAANNARQELADAIAEAHALKANATATMDDLSNSMTRMANAQTAITELLASLGVKIQYVDGVLTLIPSDPQFTVRYTLDGNEPSLLSRVYEGPVTLNQEGIYVLAQMFLGSEPMGPQAKFGTANGENVATTAGQNYYTNDYCWAGYWPNLAWDGDRVSRWAPYYTTASVAFMLDKTYTICGAAVYESAYPGRVTNYEIQVGDSYYGPWTTVLKADALDVEFSFDPVDTQYVRYVTTGANNSPNIGEIEIFAMSGPTNSSDFTALTAALADAQKVLETTYVNASAEAKAEFDYWLSVAQAVAENENSDQETVDAAAKALREAMADLAVLVTVAGEEGVTADDASMTYTVSFSNAARVATATLDLTVDNSAEILELTALNGWFIISQIVENGKVSVLMGNNAGITDEAKTDVLAVSVKPAAVGDTVLEVTKAVLSSFLGDADETYVDAVLTDAKATTYVDYSIYDVNCDGTIDQLDLTRCQRFYGMEEGAALWNARADVNRDGVISIQDMILVMNHYSK